MSPSVNKMKNCCVKAYLSINLFLTLVAKFKGGNLYISKKEILIKSLIGLLLLCTVQLYGQYLPNSLIQFDKYQMISAYAGLKNTAVITGKLRSQWQGIEGMPQQVNIQGSMPFAQLRGAAGVQIQSVSQGAQVDTRLVVSYNYIQSTSIGLFSGGIKLGVSQFSLKGGELRTPDGEYGNGSVNHNDPFLNLGTNRGLGVVYGASMYFRNRFIEGGVDLVQLPSFRLAVGAGKYTYETILNGYIEVPIVILNKIKLTPNLQLQSDFVTWQLQMMTTVEYFGNVFGGMGVRGFSPMTSDALILMFGWKFNKKYQLAYSYDVGISSLRNAHDGSHEIMFKYNLDKKMNGLKVPKIIYNPRYM